MDEVQKRVAETHKRLKNMTKVECVRNIINEEADIVGAEWERYAGILAVNFNVEYEAGTDWEDILTILTNAVVLYNLKIEKLNKSMPNSAPGRYSKRRSNKRKVKRRRHSLRSFQDKGIKEKKTIKTKENNHYQVKKEKYEKKVTENGDNNMSSTIEDEVLEMAENTSHLDMIEDEVNKEKGRENYEKRNKKKGRKEKEEEKEKEVEKEEKEVVEEEQEQNMEKGKEKKKGKIEENKKKEEEVILINYNQVEKEDLEKEKEKEKVEKVTIISVNGVKKGNDPSFKCVKRDVAALLSLSKGTNSTRNGSNNNNNSEITKNVNPPIDTTIYNIHNATNDSHIITKAIRQKQQEASSSSISLPSSSLPSIQKEMKRKIDSGYMMQTTKRTRIEHSKRTNNNNNNNNNNNISHNKRDRHIPQEVSISRPPIIVAPMRGPPLGTAQAQGKVTSLAELWFAPTNSSIPMSSRSSCSSSPSLSSPSSSSSSSSQRHQREARIYQRELPPNTHVQIAPKPLSPSYPHQRGIPPVINPRTGHRTRYISSNIGVASGASRSLLSRIAILERELHGITKELAFSRMSLLESQRARKSAEEAALVMQGHIRNLEERVAMLSSRVIGTERKLNSVLISQQRRNSTSESAHIVV